MEILCTRPGCSQPHNQFDDLDHATTLKTTQQRYCKCCGMPLILGGRYIPLRLLGKGGFGAAFLACDRHTTKLRHCVVKQFQPANNLEAKSLEIAQGLFEREAMVLEEIGTENEQIPALYAFFPLLTTNELSEQEEQYFYLVQELIKGQNLEEELATKGSFSEEAVIEILVGILPVLSYIHQRHIIHRDIKPSNIMRDQSDKLFLLDFGAVKQVTSVGTPTGSSTSIFSMGFAPPEQMRGGQVYPSTDLYALGATCVHLLTAKDTKDLFDDSTNRWDWRSHAPEVSDFLADILEKLLRSAPQERYQSAEDVQAALTGTLLPAHNSDDDITVQGEESEEEENMPPSSMAVTISPTPTPSPSAPLASPVSSSPPVRRSLAPLPVFDLLQGTAFTGFEGTLLMIAGFSLLGKGGLVLAAMAIAGLVVSQCKRWIEGKDLPILAGITALLMLIPRLHGGIALGYIFIYAVLASAGLCMALALFLLIYQILRRFL